MEVNLALYIKSKKYEYLSTQKFHFQESLTDALIYVQNNTHARLFVVAILVSTKMKTTELGDKLKSTETGKTVVASRGNGRLLLH